MMFNYKFNPERTYLLACSFGPDSMALFDLLYKNKVKFVVCHVNYHKRDVSNDEERMLREYCKERNIICEVFDTKTEKETGNFQEWAREIRYRFFLEMYEKYSAEGLFIAHQQDDLIETYIIQKQRNGVVRNYGMLPVSKMMSMTIIRPLLNYSKADLLNYNLVNHVPYSLDQSNFETKYLRNRVRKEIINKLSEVEREQYLEEIRTQNKEMENFLTNLKAKVQIGDELDIREIIALDQREFQETIIHFIATSGARHLDVSEGRISEIRKMCLSSKPNLAMKLLDNLYLVKEYDVLVLSYDPKHKPYSYILLKPGKLETEQFSLDFTSGAEDRNIFDGDYPLTIRSIKEGDKYFIGASKCQVRRLFIDWKMPCRFRDQWPIFENKKGEIVYIPRYRKRFQDNHKSTLIIKITGKKQGN